MPDAAAQVGVLAAVQVAEAAAVVVAAAVVAAEAVVDAVRRLNRLLILAEASVEALTAASVEALAAVSEEPQAAVSEEPQAAEAQAHIVRFLNLQKTLLIKLCNRLKSRGFPLKLTNMQIL